MTGLLAYLLGSIPTGYLAGRARGVDIRTLGSGNIGATNVFRVLGRPLGSVVLVIDALKGWVSAALVPGLVLNFWPGAPADAGSAPEYLRIVAGLAAILGHNYTCWLKFKGGKGIATSAGVLAALMPVAFAISLVVWIVVCRLTRYVSVASIAAALVLPFGAWGNGRSPRLIIVACAIAVLAIYKHKANLRRLMQGTENQIGRKAPPAAEGKP